MRADLERLLDDITLMTLAFAIAVGWSLFQFAHGLAVFVDGLLTHVPAGEPGGFSFSTSGLQWFVGHRYVDLDPLFTGAVELAVTLAVAVFVARRTSD